MRIQLRYITPLLAATAAAAAIAAAPTAIADTGQQCTYLGASETQCQTPGNSQINDSPPYVQYGPQYPYFLGDEFDRGGFGFGGGHGGMGGGHR